MLLLLLAACPPFDPDGPYRCESNADCLLDERCSLETCVPACTPKSCADLPGRCGPILDECGGTIECECSAPQTCGGGGRAGSCGCTPISCDGVTCGTLDDGCGATIDCGCEAPDSCGGGGSAGRCGCAPKTCDELGAECGLISDGCAETIHCGGCTWPDRCGGETDNRCGRPSACVAQEAVCGFLGAEYCGTCIEGDMCGVAAANRCGRPASCLAEGRECGFSETVAGVFCGGCGAGEMCEAGTCVRASRPFCWGERERIDLPPVQWRGRPIAEAGALVLYAEITIPGDVGCTRIARVPLATYATAATTAYAIVDGSDFSDLSLSGCTENTGVECEGWVAAPRMRADGMEMFFDSSYRCADWWDREIYLSLRRDPTEPWSRPSLLPVSEYRATPSDSVDFPVLLADGQTLVYRDGALPPGELAVARRSSTEPGDVSFSKLGSVVVAESLDDGDVLYSLVPQALSCDGAFLLYYREVTGDRPRNEARAVEIRSLDPLELGPPQPYRGVDDVHGFAEGPDCGALYFATGLDQWVRRRVPCP
jgi:hypothetical protein